MRKIIAFCAIAALGTGTFGLATAQEAAPAPPAASAEAGSEMNIMTGDSIFNLQGDEIGSIDSVNTEADGSQYAVVAVGEFLGLGGKQVLIPASELAARTEGGYSVNYTEEQLQQMPEYQGGEG